MRSSPRAGELLTEMRDNGQRQNEKGGNKVSRGVIPTPTLKDFGISLNQSSKWRQLAQVPAEKFERAVQGDGPKTTTEGIINGHQLREEPAPRMGADRFSGSGAGFGILSERDS
jgi:hypothetical protein